LILVSIGTMLPFDRLVRAVDKWAEQHPKEEVVAQIGERGLYEPKHMRWMRLTGPDEFAALVDQSRLLVAHAGTGSFLLAAERRRPIVLFPRRAALKEHTSDHQLQTARWLREKSGVYVAMTEEELPNAIAAALARPEIVVEAVPPYAPAPFLSRIREALLK
jgi:UDP-N-acetylglucosamine transferase subunit ALG13